MRAAWATKRPSWRRTIEHAVHVVELMEAEADETPLVSLEEIRARLEAVKLTLGRSPLVPWGPPSSDDKRENPGPLGPGEKAPHGPAPRVGVTRGQGDSRARRARRRPTNKLQRKVSGCFRTFEGAKHFCAIRSYLQAAFRHGKHRLDVLVALFNGNPWMPPAQAP